MLKAGRILFPFGEELQLSGLEAAAAERLRLCSTMLFVSMGEARISGLRECNWGVILFLGGNHLRRAKYGI